MRPVFDEETARELGYQKYWPEWTDWAVATLYVLLLLAGFAILLYFIFG